MEKVISNIDKLPKLKLIYFNGCVKLIRGIREVHNIRDKEIYYERDYIDSDMLKDLYEIAERYDSELVISGFYIHTYYDNENFENRNANSYRLYK